jgi:hypothetical protein
VGALLTLSAAAYFAVQSQQFQMFVVNSVVQPLSAKLNLNVSVRSVEFRLFTRLVANDVLALTHGGDTILHARQIGASISSFSIKKRSIDVRTLTIKDACLRIAADSAVFSNIPQQDSSTAAPHAYSIAINRIRLENIDFQYIKHDSTPTKNGIINFHNIHVKEFHAIADNLHWAGDTLYFEIEQAHGSERSGMTLKEMTAAVSIAPRYAAIKNLRIADEYSIVEIPALSIIMSADGNIRKARVTGRILAPSADLRSMAYFSPTIKNQKLTMSAAMHFSGIVNSLNINNIQLKIGHSTKLSAQLLLHDLSDLHNTHFDLKINELRTTASDMLLLDETLGIGSIGTYRRYLAAADSMGCTADFAGSMQDFAASAQINTRAGSANISAMLTAMPDGAHRLQCSVNLHNVHANRLLGNTDAGLLALNGNVEGIFPPKKEWQLALGANVRHFEYKGYAHSGMQARAALTAHSMRWHAAGSDSNCNFDAKGDFSIGSEPQYRFKIDVRHADLAKIGFNQRDSIAGIGFKAKGEFTGNTANNITGTADITDIQYITSSGNVSSQSMRLELAQSDDQRRFMLSSDVADAKILTNMAWAKIPMFAENLLQNIFPNYKTADTVATAPHDAYLSFWMKAKKTDALCALASPNLRLAQYAELNGMLTQHAAAIDFNTENIGWKNISLKNLAIAAKPHVAGIHSIRVHASKLLLGAVTADSIMAQAAIDSTGMLVEAVYTASQMQRKVNAHAEFLLNEDNEKSAAINIFPAVISFGKRTWNMQQCRMNIGSSSISIANFVMENQQQYLQVHGNVSRLHADSLAATLRNIDIAPFLELTGKNLYLTGTLSGQVHVKNFIKEEPTRIAANLSANSMVYDHKEIGDININCASSPQNSAIAVSAQVVKHGQTTLKAHADIAENGSVSGIADFDHAELYYLELLLKNALSEIHGTGTGRIKIDGSPKNLMLNGQLDINGCNFVVPFLNAKFIAQEHTTFDFENSNLLMKNILAHDPQGNAVRLRGDYNHITQPQNFFYNIDITPTSAIALNTTELQSPIYYGIGYGTGSVNISGVPRRCSIDVDAVVNKGTIINFSLGSKGSRSAQGAPLISFVPPKNSGIAPAHAVDAPTDISADINFNITPDATFNAILNSATGDAITMQGDGVIKMDVQPQKNIFNVFGNYVIRNGEYSVSVQNLFNKKFKIEQGSRIVFNGAIEHAAAAIAASYKLRAPLSDLFGDSTVRYRQPIGIDCKIDITGALTTPKIKFQILAPDADKETQARMQTQFSTENNTELQFFSLLLTGRFMPPQNSVDGTVIFDGVGMAGDIMVSAASKFLSQLFNVDVSANLRSRSDIPGISGGSGTLMREFGSRLVFSATLDYNSTRQSMDAASTPVSASTDLEVLMDRSGRFRIRLFGRTNDQYSEMLSGIANNAGSGGVGVVYQEDFNNFGELWERMFGRKKKNFSADTKESYPLLKNEIK